MICEYWTGSERAKCIAANGLIHANIATIANGKIIRMPKTAINIPQVKNLFCQTGVISTNLLALTIALSKDKAISKAANIPPIMRNPINPDKVPVVTQPNQADKVNPITVTIIGHFWYDKADLVIQAPYDPNTWLGSQRTI
jgi:hypothetical protein